jgi:hypothetical protein
MPIPLKKIQRESRRWSLFAILFERPAEIAAARRIWESIFYRRLPNQLGQRLRDLSSVRCNFARRVVFLMTIRAAGGKDFIDSTNHFHETYIVLNFAGLKSDGTKAVVRIAKERCRVF